ncbi:MAG: 1-acyl-sn-glycerol-3-phosphate acyltransferase [Bacteroidales bacterium]|jgi:1-acyl-sn-glycerol-3-phosphate acyltransferase|nr:1-acyl-sn-glycerol-3-phosphate acyltransferase [Bacteroidales bacterium]
MGSGINKILSVPVFAFLYCYTAAGVLIVVVLSWFKAKKSVRFLCKVWAKSVFLIMGKKLPVIGKDNIDKNEKYILVANHASLFDIVAITSFYPEVSWFGHERLLKIPVFGRFLRLTDYVPFKEPTVSNTRHMLEQLMEKARDQSVALFPEGTRTLNGEINPFYRGFIYLFRTREIDILPVTLNGFYDLKPKNRSYIDFGSRLEVIVHKPISREELMGLTDSEIIKKVRTVIESAHRGIKEKENTRENHG